MKMVHMTEFECMECKSRFESKDELGEHVKEKREQKDHEWKCDLCKKQYVCIKELKEHEKEYHDWKCDQCKKCYKGAG